MWSSVALKRSLTQIGKRSVANHPLTASLCRRSVSHLPKRSGARKQYYSSSSSTETHHTNGNGHSSNSNNDNDNQNNGTIRFTMTPKEKFCTPSHPQQYGSVHGSNDDGDDYCKTTVDFDANLFDQNAAAEQMMHIMDNSYYFASFEAGEGLST
mmetsp:Transcript_27763/g.61159  ORF Transcript_27763/g.61159 Transcript_27763/m.61159 type:complete len:154 (-) Transcript_27763:41-502(-)|eukprot:CAMPEP_0168273638 /NCGR_PEP_ID=MMETSP0141_2-20121125/16847_1 /TAXON_ID=44445 /ORGANISM="Pseudo-nitzschia australis, Strain 10249 10 AB" /LENGTH=153 /DNA_ID=CAMNT_0008215123 /DNA_START=48 /DNA_END=509 /DNA_ORIENTATION=+